MSEEAKLKKASKPRKPPTRYSLRLFEHICELISTRPVKNLSEACEEAGINVGTIFTWLAKSDVAKEGDPFYGINETYARAMETRLHLKAEDLEHTARTPLVGEIEEIEYETVPAFLPDGKTPDPEHPSGWKMVEKSRKVKRMDNVQRSALIADTDKWLLSKLQPKGRGTGRPGYGAEKAAAVGASVGDGGEITLVLVNSPDGA